MNLNHGYIVDDNLIHFGVLMLDCEIAATVAIPLSHFPEGVISERLSAYTNGAMDQGMRHNPVLRCFDEWDALPPLWTATKLCGFTTVVL